MLPFNRTTVEAISDLYSQSLRGDRYFAHLSATNLAKDQTLAALHATAQARLKKIPWIICAALALVFGFTFLSRSPALYSVLGALLILLVGFCTITFRRNRASIANNFKDHKVIKDLTGQIEDPAKAFFTLCSDGLHRAMGEIDFLKRSFSHVCRMFVSTSYVYASLAKKFRLEAGGIDINLKELPKYWNDDLQALYYVEEEIARIQRGIDYILANGATPNDQDDLCDISKLRKMCTELQKYILKSSLVGYFATDQLFVMPHPINVITGNYVISPHDIDSVPFRALARPIL